MWIGHLNMLTVCIPCHESTDSYMFLFSNLCCDGVPDIWRGGMERGGLVRLNQPLQT